MNQPASSRRRLWLCRLSCVLFGTGLALALLEFGLRARSHQIAASDRLAPGLVQSDPVLGWRLTPGWEGTHEHHDFKVRYRVQFNGFRADVVATEDFPGRRLVVVGDSFAFGLGVEDDQTFAHLLTAKARPKAVFLNASVPGYSTDQQVLLVEREILPRHPPDEIILVTYLANDLLDNLRRIPLQVRAPKPYFELEGGELVLKSGPVEVGQPAPPASGSGLLEAVMGEDVYRRSWKHRLEARSEVFKLFSYHCLAEPDHTAELAARLEPAVRLYDALLARLLRSCSRKGVKLNLVLLAGRSYVQEPGSLSAQYQEFLRNKVRESAAKSAIPTVDLAAYLRAQRTRGDFYFPNDGHLTPAGHQAVAARLAEEFLK